MFQTNGIGRFDIWTHLHHHHNRPTEQYTCRDCEKFPEAVEFLLPDRQGLFHRQKVAFRLAFC